MGNLIIKPNTGGLLKLQDEGGTDAISISTTGNTTLAGTANALGTVTAGTIGSGVTFPTGHVLNVLTNSVAGNSDTFTSTSGWIPTVAVLTVTAAEYAGGSKMYVFGEFGTSFDNWAANCRLMRDLPGSDEILSYPYPCIGQAPSYPGQWGRAWVTLQGINTITAGGADHVFRVQAEWVAGTTYYNASGSNATLRITAFVIK
jgi:hypothetical protein